MNRDATNEGLLGGIICTAGALPVSANKGNHYQPSLPKGEINFAPEWTNPYDGHVAATGAQMGFRAVLRSANDSLGIAGYLASLDVIAIERIALDPSTPVGVLDHISRHPSADLRAALAENHSTSEEILWKLACDQDPDVRYQIAENPHIAINMLRALGEDENPYVACRAQQTLSRIEAI